MTFLLGTVGAFDAPQWLTIALVVMTVVFLVVPATYVSYTAKKERKQTRDALVALMEVANLKLAQTEDRDATLARLITQTLRYGTDMTPEQANDLINKWAREFVVEEKVKAALKDATTIEDEAKWLTR